MPGVIMEHESRNGSHTNHDRDQRPNGVNGANYPSDKQQDKGKGRAEPVQNPTPANQTIDQGSNGTSATTSQQENGESGIPRDLLEQVPDEIAHITEGYMPLSMLLTRLAQRTHSDLIDTIKDLAQMPTPSSALNGNASHITATDDSSAENINKKLRLMNFATSAHEQWTKALVMTGWSRRSDDVRRIIDLKIHLDQQKVLYTEAVDSLANNKRALLNFRLPNPDFKTALEVLTTGKASWMPDLNYIQPPSLTAKEVLKSLEKLNTLLSIRLNLNDYDNLPLQFKDYTIHSGRATFKVPGEFEIDLTVADEDPESQYWFIDFRFSFRPSLATIGAGARWHIENKVNEVLLKDGLSGCYKYLHELVLTYKINEFRRQGLHLARTIWVDTLKLEILNRPISIQYWLNRYGKASKSWIILGVHSGKPLNGRPDLKATSRLFIRWFRDSKEVKDAEIPFDTVDISTESLLRTVIASHVKHILTSMYNKLAARPLFANRDLELSLNVSDDPAQSELKVQLTNEHHLSIKIEPISGRFVFGPVYRTYSEFEHYLNTKSVDPAIDGHKFIERLRCQLLSEDMHRHAFSVGWHIASNPGVKQDIVQQHAGKETLTTVWLRRIGWSREWFVIACQSMSGAKWLLLRIVTTPTPLDAKALGVASAIPIPLSTTTFNASYSFMSTVNVFIAGLVSHYTNVRALHAKRVHHILLRGQPSKSITLPAIYSRLSELLPSKNRSARTGKPWAKDVIKLTFQGIEVVQQKQTNFALPASTAQLETQQSSAPGSQLSGDLVPRNPSNAEENAVLITEARMVLPLPEALKQIHERVDPDIVFNPETGSFAFRLHSKVGESVIPILIERIVRVEQLVEFVQVLQKHKDSLKCETVSLGKIIFTYQNVASAATADAVDADPKSTDYRATVDFSAGENTIVLVLQKGNPHLRVADILTKVLNADEGLDGVATLIPLTLPIVRGLDAIESSWASDALSENAEVFVNVRAADWYVIRYNLLSPTPRRTTFEIRLRQRAGAAWWFIRRTDSLRNNNTPDALDEALKPLWAASGPGWRGMRTSGVAQGSGAEEMLSKMDEVVRTFVLSGTSIDAPLPVAQAQPVPALAPPQKQVQAPNMRPQQQQRQQHTPNQSQNGGSQGRPVNLKREIVEID